MLDIYIIYIGGGFSSSNMRFRLLLPNNTSRYSLYQSTVLIYMVYIYIYIYICWVSTRLGIYINIQLKYSIQSNIYNLLRIVASSVSYWPSAWLDTHADPFTEAHCQNSSRKSIITIIICCCCVYTYSSSFRQHHYNNAMYILLSHAGKCAYNNKALVGIY